MIVDRSQAGLDWRIDATKDIGDIGSLRNQKTDLNTLGTKSLNFGQNLQTMSENTTLMHT